MLQWLPSTGDRHPNDDLRRPVGRGTGPVIFSVRDRGQFQDILSSEIQDILTGGSEKGGVLCEENGMPWKNTTMNTLRKEFALKALAASAHLTALCREYGVTRKTGRQWRERAKADAG